MATHLRKAKQFRKKRLKKRTTAELKFQRMLDDLEINYEAEMALSNQRGEKIVKIFFVDFYLPEYKVVVEIDGGYHFDKYQMAWDMWREGLLLKKGWVLKIVRFTNEEIMLQPERKTMLKLICEICPPVYKLFEIEILKSLTDDLYDMPKYGHY